MDGAGRAADQAHRIHTVHAGVGHRDIEVRVTVTDKPRIPAMCGSACANAVVAIDAAIRIDQHRRRAVDNPVIDEEINQRLLDAVVVNHPLIG